VRAFESRQLRYFLSFYRASRAHRFTSNDLGNALSRSKGVETTDRLHGTSLTGIGLAKTSHRYNSHRCDADTDGFHTSTYIVIDGSQADHERHG